MKKLALAFLLCGASAFATPVTYSTTVTLNGAGPATTETYTQSAGNTITATGFTGVTISDPVNGSSANLVTFSTAGTLTSVSIPFTLTLTQSVPAPSGTQSFGSATISGTITTGAGGSGQLNVQYTNPVALTFTEGALSTTYTLVFSNIATDSFNVPFNNPNTQQALVSQVTSGTPEPASFGLLGGSLLGLGLLIRRTAKK